MDYYEYTCGQISYLDGYGYVFDDYNIGVIGFAMD
jgi:hypothetical protein